MLDITWAYFGAFNTVLYFNFIRFKTWKLGIKDPDKFLNTEHVKNILKAPLPHQTKFIDEQDPGVYYYLIEELGDRLLSELRKILGGKEADQSLVQRVKEILSATKEANEANKQASAI